MAAITLDELRRRAMGATLFPPTTLQAAVEKLGFVQCDPIRAPARAQDLILRQRVTTYRAGDLERQYPELGFEEDYLYAYGVVPETTWRLLHPRKKKRLTKDETRVWELVCAQAQMHPRELEPHLGRRRRINAWGGYSKATTRILENLHFRGWLRVCGREKGIRLYQQARPQDEHLAADERLKHLILLVARLLAPAPERSLRKALNHLSYSAPDLHYQPKILKRLIDTGDLSAAEIGGIRYLWPSTQQWNEISPTSVRFLAPFDPVVWDRYRFEHLWGWPYRFEAYTPIAKRKLGYYALPLAWGDNVIGWVNVTRHNRTIKTDPGFIKAKPRGSAFKNAFAEEVERMTKFLEEAALASNF